MCAGSSFGKNPLVHGAALFRAAPLSRSTPFSSYQRVSADHAA